MRQPKHAKKIPMGSFLASRQRSKRAYKGRAYGQRKQKVHPRAHEEIQAEHAARTVRSKPDWAVSMMIGFSLFRKGDWKVQPPTHICAF
jgi:hypothetical protein